MARDESRRHLALFSHISEGIRMDFGDIVGSSGALRPRRSGRRGPTPSNAGPRALRSVWTRSIDRHADDRQC
jgi:hypothetical protein